MLSCAIRRARFLPAYRPLAQGPGADFEAFGGNGASNIRFTRWSAVRRSSSRKHFSLLTVGYKGLGVVHNERWTSVYVGRQVRSYKSQVRNRVLYRRP